MAYKYIDPNTINISTFKVYKSWACNQYTTSSINAKVQTGTYSSMPVRELGDANPDGSYKKLIWHSINNLFYETGSCNYYKFLNPEAVSIITRSLQDTISVITIDKDTFGESIKKGSVIIETGSLTFLDDSKYNLYVSGTSPHDVIGNVLYEHGKIIITSASYASTFLTYDIQFKSTFEITEHEYPCTINSSEFNYTMNQTATSGSNNDYLPMFTSSLESPLITTIGLYNSLNELLMVAKLPRPYRRNYDLDTTFIIKFDT